jgi:hypothetical protein
VNDPKAPPRDARAAAKDALRAAMRLQQQILDLIDLIELIELIELGATHGAVSAVNAALARAQIMPLRVV